MNRPVWVDYLLEVLCGTAIVLVTLAVIFVPFIVFSTVNCNAVGNAMSLPHYYTFGTGCMIQVDGQWLPLDKYVVADTHSK